MAGIYIHIPFCKQKCTYCDFHFSTSLKYKEKILDAMYQELEQKNGIDEEITTLYFGGGTPSFITVDEIDKFIHIVNKRFRANIQELTIEANPDDLTIEKLKALKSIGINRLSIGIQTFNEDVLKWMNRSHSANQAIQCVNDARNVGFGNISLDLIFAIPNLSMLQFEKDINQMIALQPQHISTYNLTVEHKTALHHQVKKGQISPVNDEIAARQYDIIINKLKGAGFNQYEISNFSLPGFESKHNTSYWEQKQYIGIGPSAHSFNGKERQWNIANNLKYAELIVTNQSYFEKEVLQSKDLINEYLLTGLRTKRGCNWVFLKNALKADIKPIQEYIYRNEEMFITGTNGFSLSKKGWFIADRIISDLFV